MTGNILSSFDQNVDNIVRSPTMKAKMSYENMLSLLAEHGFFFYTSHIPETHEVWESPKNIYQVRIFRRDNGVVVAMRAPAGKGTGAQAHPLVFKFKNKKADAEYYGEGISGYTRATPKDPVPRFIRRLVRGTI